MMMMMMMMMGGLLDLFSDRQLLGKNCDLQILLFLKETEGNASWGLKR